MKQWLTGECRFPRWGVLAAITLVFVSLIATSAVAQSLSVAEHGWRIQAEEWQCTVEQMGSRPASTLCYIDAWAPPVGYTFLHRPGLLLGFVCSAVVVVSGGWALRRK